MQREVDRLERAGVVVSERIGNARTVRANRQSPIYPELRGLLLKAFGPPGLLAEALSKVAGVDEAYIFGSWARRFHGEPGELPRDVDVLVVGNADADAVYDASREVERQLGIDVNPIVVAPSAKDSPVGIVARVQQEPLVRIDLSNAVDR